MLTNGIRIAASGMESVSRAQDVTANNIANVNTPGYKKDTAVFHSFDRVLRESAGPESRAQAPRVQSVSTDHSQGPVVRTDNPLDLAIRGEGYFAVETPEGVRYTRAGNFTVNQAGELATVDGYPVLGDGGPVSVPAGGRLSFGEDGTVFSDGVPVDRLRLATCPPEQRFVKAGKNLFSLEGGDEVRAAGGILAGHLEQSTVESVTEMVSMIGHLRAYEALQKVVRIQDNTLDKAVNSVGRV